MTLLLIFENWFYNTARIIALPFNDIPDLLSNTDFRIMVKPGTSLEDAFKNAQNTYWQATWIQRVQPYLKENIGLNNEQLISVVVDDSTLALYDNHFAIM